MNPASAKRRAYSGKVNCRTPVKPFDADRADPFLMKAGDAVQFYPIDRAEYDRWA